MVFLISHPAEFAVSHLKGGDLYTRQTSSDVPLCKSESLHAVTTLHFTLVHALFVIKIVMDVHLDTRLTTLLNSASLIKEIILKFKKGEYHARLINVPG